MPAEEAPSTSIRSQSNEMQITQGMKRNFQQSGDKDHNFER